MNALPRSRLFLQREEPRVSLAEGSARSEIETRLDSTEPDKEETAAIPEPSGAGPSVSITPGKAAEFPSTKGPTLPEADTSAPPAVHAEAFLRRLDTAWQGLDRLIHGVIPPALNPLGQLGAIANTCLILAVVTGVLLLFWYTPSVHHAYASLEQIKHSSWLGQLLRSLHRYSSDGCLFFILLHAVRIVAQRRFTGARWLAWTTGIVMLALIWFIGWTGYWLVWDVRAQHAALGTARFIDRLPIFAEPLSRSFLTDDSVPSLLFFLIFFVHMLAPLAVGVGIWMHLMRLNRSRFLAGRAMTLWILGSMIGLSLVAPALSVGPAQMTAKPPAFTIDGWFLWPVVLTDRLGGGALWAFFLGTGLLAISVPWWMVKRRRAPAWKAQVELSRCMGCTLCAQDCPFNAIAMVPRNDGRKFSVQSQVNPDLCVGCGLCTGSCDSQAINLPALNSREVERRLLAGIDARLAAGERPFVAFCCAESAGSLLAVGADGRSTALPGYYLQPVPCVGWLSAVMLERALQRGARGVLVVACGEGDTVTREGLKWFEQRMDGRREPRFDPGRADPARVRWVKLDRTRGAELQRVAREFLESPAARPPAVERPRGRQIIAGVGLAAVLGAVIWAVSDLPYRTAHSAEPELVVSFSHGGAILEPRQLTPEELQKRLPHMRAQVSVARSRAPVRLRVQVDGRTVLDQLYQPKGISKDGPSVAVARLP
ncbi:MAG TPA: hydrogenase iron-sulfur subunit, partial [Methylomirabilota bacterium]|nr:hydrogenase iron-sulfur subunit [Methylomirabilota bacterium]